MISLPSILKRFINPKAAPFRYPVAEELNVDTVIEEPQAAPAPQDPELSAGDLISSTQKNQSTLDYAKLQGEAIMEAARQEAAEYLERAKLDLAPELERIRSSAQEEGFRSGYTEGISHAHNETLEQRAAQAVKIGSDVTRFLEKATLAQEELLTQTQNELRDLSIAIAEKIVRVSLKNSGDVISRMIQRATEKLRRKEWVHIYIAGCDAKAFAQASPTLTAALGAISDQVKIIPLPEEESGTCMIEMPDEIIDASVSTQITNIRGLLSDSYMQSNAEPFRPTLR